MEMKRKNEILKMSTVLLKIEHNFYQNHHFTEQDEVILKFLQKNKWPRIDTVGSQEWGGQPCPTYYCKSYYD